MAFMLSIEIEARALHRILGLSRGPVNFLSHSRTIAKPSEPVDPAM